MVSVTRSWHQWQWKFMLRQLCKVILKREAFILMCGGWKNEDIVFFSWKLWKIERWMTRPRGLQDKKFSPFTEPLKLAVRFYQTWNLSQDFLNLYCILPRYSTFNKISKKSRAACFKKLLQRGDFSLQIDGGFSCETIFLTFLHTFESLQFLRNCLSLLAII